MNIPLMPKLPKITQQRSNDQSWDDFQRELIRQEAQIGGRLFGAVPAGHNRQFFCLDVHNWVWHEQWQDANGKQHVITTRYEVRPDGIIKSQDNQPYRRLSGAEAHNLYRAVLLYQQRVDAHYQRMLQTV